VDEVNENNNEAHQVLDVQEEEGPQEQNYIVIAFVIIVLIAVIVLYYLNRKGKLGLKPKSAEEDDDEIPTAEVVSEKSSKKSSKGKGKEPDEPSMGGHGGIRLG
jgi:hypothetical protein